MMGRLKPCVVGCRLTFAEKARFKKICGGQGKTQQEILEKLVIDFVRSSVRV
jgi:hypothetical protein